MMNILRKTVAACNCFTVRYINKFHILAENSFLQCRYRYYSDLRNQKCYYNTETRNKYLPNDSYTLKDFISQSPSDYTETTAEHYISLEDSSYGNGRNVYIETYGCQMNVNDTELVSSILMSNGYSKTHDMKQADVLLLMTCSIRDSAEEKIRQRLKYFGALRKKYGRAKAQKIGVLGCMAERLKTKLLEEQKMVDVVCGPDAYRDLPRLLSVTEPGLPAVNVQLSLEETYADIVPVRLDENAVTAFVSIMRGCDNMCTYCIVPFTRGRERSRPIASIADEIRRLSDRGVKEVTLLGQNVNSYRDKSSTLNYNEKTKLAPGFKSIYKPKVGGARFVDLLDCVSNINPEMRFRFTSPHPKDFPEQLLQLIDERANICNHLHLPAQSGNSAVLERMQRGYTREAYVSLVETVRSVIPDVALSSDFIAGFCGESDEEHRDTVSLLERVKYHFVFAYPYSMRQKTRAFHRLVDDVPNDIKRQRHTELLTTFRHEAYNQHLGHVGQRHLVLIEGASKRSDSDLAGRNDYNTKVIIPDIPVAVDEGSTETCRLKPGDYVAVQIDSCSSQVLKGHPLYRSNISSFSSESHFKDLLGNCALNE